MSAEPIKTPRPRILLVDDEAGLLAMASKILGRHYEVMTANGGDAALSMLTGPAPDIALVDYRMPGLTGVEVLEKIAELVPDCLRMLVTGDSDRMVLQAAINRARIYRFIAKPVAYPALLEDLRLALEHRDAQGQVRRSERLALAGLTSSIAAHDIRNGLQGLAVVPTYIDLGTAQDLQAAKDAVDYAQEVMRGCVEEILAVSRGKSLPMKKVRSSLPELVSRLAVYEMGSLAGRSLKVDTAITVPDIWISESHCRRLVGNLVRNAIQATQPGGTIVLRVWQPCPDQVCVSVADDGPGIPPEVEARIFQPFTSTKGENGSGFGLKMCKDVMTAHGGTLSFTTAAGVGTTFVASFPLQEHP